MKQTEIRLGTHGEDYGNWMPNLILYTVGGMFVFMAALTVFCFTAFYFPHTGTIFAVTAALLLALLLWCAWIRRQYAFNGGGMMERVHQVVLSHLDFGGQGQLLDVGCGSGALSIRAATGKPIKFVGTGEKLDMIEPFHPDRMASRILGMGDMLSFIEKAQQTYDEKQAKKLEEKLKKNSFTLSDYFDQLQQIRNMGDLSQLAGMMPGNLGSKLQGAQIDEKAIAHTEAIILSMTPEERENPQILGASRKKRIAAGCGLDVVDVNRLLKQFEGMQQIIKQVTGGRKPGFGFGGLGHGRGLRKRKKK